MRPLTNVLRVVWSRDLRYVWSGVYVQYGVVVWIFGEFGDEIGIFEGGKGKPRWKSWIIPVELCLFCPHSLHTINLQIHNRLLSI